MRDPGDVAAEMCAQTFTVRRFGGQRAVRQARDFDSIVRTQEARDERGRGAVKNLLGRTVLHDASGVDDGDAIRKRQRFLAVVRDVDGGDADSSLERAQLVTKLDAHFVVEVRHRLVEEQELRIDGERATERNTLSLSAR